MKIFLTFLLLVCGNILLAQNTDANVILVNSGNNNSEIAEKVKSLINNVNPNTSRSGVSKSEQTQTNSRPVILIDNTTNPADPEMIARLMENRALKIKPILINAGTAREERLQNIEVKIKKMLQGRRN